MEMLSRNEDGMNWSSVPGTTVDFELKDGSEFVLDTGDEVEMERTGRGGMMVNGAWFHGMVTAVEDDGISCGFVARDVRTVRDVRLDTDVVILAGGSYVQTSKYVEHVEDERRSFVQGPDWSTPRRGSEEVACALRQSYRKEIHV